MAQTVKRLSTMRETRGSIPGSGRSAGEGNGNPLQYSCLENPMDRGAWWATVHGVAKSRTQLCDLLSQLKPSHSDLLSQLKPSHSDFSYLKKE